jgi:hypothetical protein
VGIRAAALACYLVECYRPELDEALESIAAKVDQSSASVRTEGSRVRRVVTLAVPSDEVVFGVFAASSADIVCPGVPAVQGCRPLRRRFR